jgi:hypothetical protein
VKKEEVGLLKREEKNGESRLREVIGQIRISDQV